MPFTNSQIREIYNSWILRDQTDESRPDIEKPEIISIGTHDECREKHSWGGETEQMLFRLESRNTKMYAL